MAKISDAENSVIMKTYRGYEKASDLVFRYFDSVCQGDWQIETSNRELFLVFKNDKSRYVEKIASVREIETNQIDFAKRIKECTQMIKDKYMPTLVMKKIMQI